jgi:hypothetical protein
MTVYSTNIKIDLHNRDVPLLSKFSEAILNRKGLDA